MAATNFQHGLVLSLSGLKNRHKLKPVRFDNGEPVYRFKVQAVPAGKFLTADNQPFQVTKPTLEHWAKTFAQFSNRGIPVPVLTGTHLEPTAEHSVGKVIAANNDGKSLWLTVELVGKDAPRLAASNSVSIYAEPEWTDAKGNKYEWPLRHLLITPDPRIPGLKGFVPIAASNGKTYKVPVWRYQKPLALASSVYPGEEDADLERDHRLDQEESQPSEASIQVARAARIKRGVNKNSQINPPKGTKAMTGKKSKLPAIGLDDYGTNDDGLGVPGVGDGPAMLPEDDTAGDPNVMPTEDLGSLKEQIKEHFIGKAHMILDDEQMDKEEKLEGMSVLLEQLEGVLDAFPDEGEGESDSEEEDMPEENEEPTDVEEETGERGAAMSNMPSLRKAIGSKDAQIAQLTSRMRRQEINALWLSGRISPVQKKQLEQQFLAPQHVTLSLSNEAAGNSFDQAISLLNANEEGIYGEKTGIQHGGHKALALSNPFNENQKHAEEDAELAKPSSLRAKKNK